MIQHECYRDVKCGCQPIDDKKEAGSKLKGVFSSSGSRERRCRLSPVPLCVWRKANHRAHRFFVRNYSRHGACSICLEKGVRFPNPHTHGQSVTQSQRGAFDRTGKGAIHVWRSANQQRNGQSNITSSLAQQTRTVEHVHVTPQRRVIRVGS